MPCNHIFAKFQFWSTLAVRLWQCHSQNEIRDLTCICTHMDMWSCKFSWDFLILKMLNIQFKAKHYCVPNTSFTIEKLAFFLVWTLCLQRKTLSCQLHTHSICQVKWMLLKVIWVNNRNFSVVSFRIRCVRMCYLWLP